jgi:malonate transporter
MLSILAVTLPIFLLVAIGYGAARFGPLTVDQVRGISWFVLNIALPALLFQLLTRSRLQDRLEWHYLLVYGTGSLAMLLGGFVYWRFVEKTGAPSAAVRGFGMANSNTGFMGLPIALQFIGPEAAFAVALNLVVENLLILPGLMILGHDRQAAGGGLAGKLRMMGTLVRSPLILAIVAAVLSVAMALTPIAPIARVINLLAGAASPMALFAIGGSLAGLRIGGMVRPVLQISAGKLILHPLIMIALLQIIVIGDPALRRSAVLLAAMPMASVYPIFGERYGEGRLAAATLLFSMVASFATINLVLLLIARGLLG